MATVDQLTRAARAFVDDIVALASEMLDAGVAASRVHARSMSAAFELVEEVEARAVLASAGDRDALIRLELVVDELRRLKAEAAAELADHAE